MNEKMHWIFWIALISFGGGVKANNDKCEKKNNDFAVYNSNFIQCVTQHDKNASYCLECSAPYSNTAAAYIDLTHDDDNPNVTKCRPDYVDNNLLNLVDVLMSNTQRIWDMAVCSDCFEGICDGTTPAQCVVSNRTRDFKSLYERAFNCINDNGKLSCNVCHDQYNNLTNFYNKIRKETNDKFCFDLKNMMNQTQKLWSLKYGCCNDKNPPPGEFYAMSASSFFIAIFFYVAAFFHGKRRPEIQYIPDDLLPIDHSRSANDSSTTQSDNEQPTTSKNILEPPTKTVESTNDTDDDDEPVLCHPISNPNLMEI